MLLLDGIELHRHDTAIELGQLPPQMNYLLCCGHALWHKLSGKIITFYTILMKLKAVELFFRLSHLNMLYSIIVILQGDQQDTKKNTIIISVFQDRKIENSQQDLLLFFEQSEKVKLGFDCKMVCCGY